MRRRIDQFKNTTKRSYPLTPLLTSTSKVPLHTHLKGASDHLPRTKGDKERLIGILPYQRVWRIWTVHTNICLLLCNDEEDCLFTMQTTQEISTMTRGVELLLRRVYAIFKHVFEMWTKTRLRSMKLLGGKYSEYLERICQITAHMGKLLLVDSHQ